ncbi:9953_t:CDS:1, partial [Scutellospora calospora]
EVPWIPQNSASTSASTNEISNEPNNETNNRASNKYFQTIGRKKRQATNKKKPSNTVTSALTNQRSNASYIQFFFKDNKTDIQIKYYKVCIKECEGS